MKNIIYELRLFSEEELLQIIKDNLRHWASEEFNNNPHSIDTLTQRFQNNKDSLIKLIQDF